MHMLPMQVYFLTQTGNIHLLCPVAPFGSRVSIEQASDLYDAVSDIDDDSAPTTSAAWLQQVILDENMTPNLTMNVLEV